jgi:hypothetical protein
MTWEDIKNRKEDSIRESTENPMPKPIVLNEKKYNSITDYLNSKEYIELLKLEEEAIEEYKKRAKEYFKSLEVDNQLFLFFHITNCIYENYFNDNGSYRGLLYDKFGFGPDSYSIGLDSGMFAVHNSISTPKENEERFQAFMKFLKLELSKEDMKSARNYFEYGFDNSEKISSMASGQQVIDFNKDPK